MQITSTGLLTKHVLLSMAAIAMCHRFKKAVSSVHSVFTAFIDSDALSTGTNILSKWEYLYLLQALSPIISFPAVIYGLVSFKEIPIFVIAGIEESTRRRRVTNPLVCFCLAPLSQTYHIHLSFITMPDLCVC